MEQAFSIASTTTQTLGIRKRSGIKSPLNGMKKIQIPTSTSANLSIRLRQES